MRILVVCGAGASSTFVAARIRRSARDRGIEAVVVPTSEALLAGQVADADVILLGVHVADHADAVRALAGSAPVVTMPESAFTDQSGDAALDAALDAVGARS